ncbi:alkaline proteinase [Apiospora phragmitis]|uniref:Alkaline proteinase n=1 Tax=Apiospora phragmitis TaxID=2905665 RepID=A0ABR1WWE1_9PEZI
MIFPLTVLLGAGAALAAPFIPRSTEFTTEAAKHGWIVVMNDDAPHEAFLHTRNLAAAAGAAPHHTFDFGEGLMRGYVMRGPGSEMAVQSMADSPHIAFIQPDTPFSLYDTVHNDTEPVSTSNDDGPVTRLPVNWKIPGNWPWGLHRISHGPIQWGQPLEYRPNSTGRTGTVYILDTGIDLDHPEFGGRAKWGGTFLEASHNNEGEGWMPTGGDDHGHGTRKSLDARKRRRIIGGKSLGVAQETNLVALKVINKEGNGHPSNVLRAMQWVIKDAEEHQRLNKSVVNMSIGSTIASEFQKAGKPDAVMIATRIASKKGIFMVAAAGNNYGRVEKCSPAAEPEACTIAAVDIYDTKAWFSNYGVGVDLLAPGVEVLSAWPGGGTKAQSGTSMAAPHAAGLGAYIMDLDGPGQATPGRRMCDRLQSIGSYRKDREGKEAPADTPDVYNEFTRIASNGMQS